LTQISPACDCYPFNDAPMVADIGILASTDLVAIDQAAADLVNQAPGLPGTELKHAHAPGEDKFLDIYPKIDWQIQLAYAQEIGLGRRDYELVKI
ncbi:MAG: 4Fe-4S ferredoxin, partial [Proteobacteria bacterium]|nr:4Fe-4S ferredoxin [Pseudomonadota bacterium]